jgi:MoaA/NifB/PqqE/SkfB family radical SAM enzyme
VYLKLTTKCNMKCQHCCMSATRKGEDMAWETFKAAVDGWDGGDGLTLGGGEPTLHPEFERFLFYALAQTDPSEGGLLVVTNGSQTERALTLALLAKRGVLAAALSRDPWHDPIDEKVVEAFTKNTRGNYYNTDTDYREIRDVSRGVLRVGRAARKSFTNYWETRNGCACDGDPVVDPNGNVHQCGCPKSPIVGNVFTGYESLTDGMQGNTNGEPWACYRDVQKFSRKNRKALDNAA